GQGFRSSDRKIEASPGHVMSLMHACRWRYCYHGDLTAIAGPPVRPEPPDVNCPMGDAALLLPLTMLDESLLITQETRAAWNVQFEVAADHRVDGDRLRQAVRSWCRRHPMARARLAPADNGSSYSQWDIADDVDRDPLRVVDCPDATALDALRAELYTPP